MTPPPLDWSPKPPVIQTLMSLGCGGLLMVLVTAAGIAAVIDGSWSSLLGVPVGLLFAAAFLVVGLRRDRVNLTDDRVVLASSLLSLRVRTVEHPFGTPRLVLLQTLPMPKLIGRPATMYVVVIRGEQDARVESFDDEGLARERAATVATHLAVPLQPDAEPLQP